jgi:signal transduction histidine kinase
MVSLIDGLLVYSRIGRTEVATEDVNISQLIAEIIDSLAPPFTFRIGVEAELPNFLTRKLLLFQVLSNLISNAIKHNDKANGRIDISACFDGQVYRFSVADNGPGIEKENQERIFGIFQTLKSRDIQENTGIGLSIVKKIVETEGGSISLESEPGQGSIFSFTWPA